MAGQLVHFHDRLAFLSSGALEVPIQVAREASEVEVPIPVSH